MAAGVTYVPLATTSVSNGTTNYMEFTSISGSYTDVILVVQGGNQNASYGLGLRFNSDSGNNYSVTQLTGTGSTTPSSARESSQPQIIVGGNGFGGSNLVTDVTIINVMNYSNSTTYKTTIGRNNIPGSVVGSTIGLWRSTSAITTIRITAQNSYFVNGATATLYGIQAA
jgi:hypothetical protein